jgi:hypothetical protein
MIGAIAITLLEGRELREGIWAGIAFSLVGVSFLPLVRLSPQWGYSEKVTPRRFGIAIVWLIMTIGPVIALTVIAKALIDWLFGV